MKALERAHRKRRQANEILRKTSTYFAQARLDPRFQSGSPSLTITGMRPGSGRSAGWRRSPCAPSMHMQRGARDPVHACVPFSLHR